MAWCAVVVMGSKAEKAVYIFEEGRIQENRLEEVGDVQVVDRRLPIPIYEIDVSDVVRIMLKQKDARARCRRSRYRVGGIKRGKEKGVRRQPLKPS